MKLDPRRFAIPGPLKTLIKLIILMVILFLIIRKIDERILLEVITSVQPFWLIWALGWYILSKIIAAFRFNLLLRTEQVHMSQKQNLKLYWLCMYYNLLLPGGISGDGYKVKVIVERFGKSFKRIISLTLVDRISGLIALGQLSVILLLWLPEIQGYWYLSLLLLLLSLVLGRILYHLAGGSVSTVWIKNSFQSLGVQGAQVIATLGLIWALGQGSHWPDYLLLFLISSFVAMIPMTIGGAGARELTFLYGAPYLMIQEEKAVAIGFLFYMISTLVALWGIVFSFRKT